MKQIASAPGRTERLGDHCNTRRRLNHIRHTGYGLGSSGVETAHHSTKPRWARYDGREHTRQRKVARKDGSPERFRLAIDARKSHGSNQFEILWILKRYPSRYRQQ